MNLLEDGENITFKIYADLDLILMLGKVHIMYKRAWDGVSIGTSHLKN